jgi:hypothetical protein
MNVLIIPEDFRKDRYIVDPLIKRMFRELGRQSATVRVCMDPLLGGISEALKWQRIEEVLDRYTGMINLFLLLVDRDGEIGRRVKLDSREEMAAKRLGAYKRLFAENAWEEIEVWALAGQNLPADWKWKEIRGETHPKELYFERLAKSRGLLKEPGEGRTTMGREAASNYQRVKSLCGEDFGTLEQRIRDWLATN